MKRAPTASARALHGRRSKKGTPPLDPAGVRAPDWQPIAISPARRYDTLFARPHKQTERYKDREIERGPPFEEHGVLGLPDEARAHHDRLEHLALDGPQFAVDGRW